MAYTISNKIKNKGINTQNIGLYYFGNSQLLKMNCHELSHAIVHGTVLWQCDRSQIKKFLNLNNFRNMLTVMSDVNFHMKVHESSFSFVFLKQEN